MSSYIFDVETTGATSPEIIEAAWINISNPIDLLKISSWKERFKPSKRIELGALAVHHILDEELEGCADSSLFKLPSDASYIIGHNIDYDWQAAGSPDVKRICTLALARKFVENLDSYSQSALIYHFYRHVATSRLKEAHSALADVENCQLLLAKLIETINKKQGYQVRSWQMLWEISEKARIPKVMPFGKHKGLPISELPKGYQNWALAQETIDPYVKQAIKQYCA